VTVIATLQNNIVYYNTLKLAYLLIVGIVAQAVGIYAFWWTQQYFKLGTKTMFNAIAFAIILLDGWGMIGNWTDRFGFHNVWEVWVCPLCCWCERKLINCIGLSSILRAVYLSVVQLLADYDL
jgi:hypothetical protein